MAPRKIPGKINTLLIWLLKSLRPVPTTAAPAALASSGMISGIGLAMAKMNGSGFMVRTMAWVTQLALLTPTNTSAPTRASAKDPFLQPGLVNVAKDRLAGRVLISGRSGDKIPVRSQMNTCLTASVSGYPWPNRSSAMAVPAAPAPLITTVRSDRRLPVSFAAFIRAASRVMDVPCWSS